MCILNTKIIEIKHCRVKRKGGGDPTLLGLFSLLLLVFVSPTSLHQDRIRLSMYCIKKYYKKTGLREETTSFKFICVHNL